MTGSERIKISKNWKFHPGPAPGAEAPGFDDRAWRTLDVPHDWSIEGAFAEAHFRAGYDADGLWIPRADSFLPRGTGWYRKALDIPRLFPGQQTYLEFEGVFRNSTLWVNGRRAGTHPSGYAGCVYNLTPFLGADGPGDLLALAVDAEREGWWYEGGGSTGMSGACRSRRARASLGTARDDRRQAAPRRRAGARGRLQRRAAPRRLPCPNDWCAPRARCSRSGRPAAPVARRAPSRRAVGRTVGPQALVAGPAGAPHRAHGGALRGGGGGRGPHRDTLRDPLVRVHAGPGLPPERAQAAAAGRVHPP